MTDRELLEENNKMLKEILSFVRKVDSAEYRDHQDFMEFLRNVAADIWVEYNEIKDRVLKYVYNIKQERSYNNDLVGIFERYKDIADGDMEVAMNFIKEAYPFNEETESFIRKKFDMPIPDESKEQ